MALRHEQVNNFKEAILVVCMLYFYGLSLAMQFDRPTYGLDSPQMFLPVAAMFLIAIALEALLAWWKKRVFLFWVTAWIVAYAIIWLYIAPKVLGDGVIPYALITPLVLIFFGGFAYVYTLLFSRSLTPKRLLPTTDIDASLASLPGWKATTQALEKTYRFKDFIQALNFLNQVARLSKRSLLCSRITLSYDEVSLQLHDWEVKGVTRGVIELARRLDAVGA